MQENDYILDANAVLRYLLQDNAEQFEKVKKLVLTERCIVTLEVIAEVFYVLEGLYKVSRTEIIDIIKRLNDDVIVLYDDILLRALEIYDKSPKVDFVDCLMYGYNRARNLKIVTFDQKLEKILKKEI